MKNYIFTLIALVLPYNASASLEETYQRESDVSAYSNALYDFQWTRAKDFYGEQGFLVHAESFHTQGQAWLENWETIQSKISSHSGSSLNEVESLITAFLRGQSRGLAEIAVSQEKMNAAATRLKLGSQSMKILPASDTLGPYNTRFVEVHGQIMGVVESVVQAAMEQFANFEKMVKAYSFEFLATELRREAINRGIEESGPQVSQMVQYIKAETLGGPMIEELTESAKSVRRLAINLEGLTLKDQLIQFGETCADVAAQLGGLQGIGEQKGRLLGEAEAICNTEKNHYDLTINIYSPQQIASSMHRGKITKHRQVCSTDPTSQRCHLYSWLKGISPSDVENYEQNEIQQLENLWQSISGVNQSSGRD